MKNLHSYESKLRFGQIVPSFGSVSVFELIFVEGPTLDHQENY